MGGKKAATLVATYLHAFVLLASLILVPADPLLKTYENAASLTLIDQAPDEPVEEAANLDGDDHLFWLQAQQAEVSLRDGERRCHSQDAPRASGCVQTRRR